MILSFSIIGPISSQADEGRPPDTHHVSHSDEACKAMNSILNHNNGMTLQEDERIYTSVEHRGPTSSNGQMRESTPSLRIRVAARVGQGPWAAEEPTDSLNPDIKNPKSR